jgi:hypothetical protein
MAAAEAHGLMPLVGKHLETRFGELLSTEWRTRLAEEFLRQSCHALSLTAELFRVLGALQGEGVRTTPYKGPVLAAQCYGNIALREFSDLDLIVPQQQMMAAHGALLSLGYRSELADLGAKDPFGQIPGEYVYRKPGAMVELHTERTLRYFPRPLELDELCERRTEVSVAGQRILTFSPEDTLLLLSVHGSKHLWERLAWVADIEALTNGAQVDWELLLRRARKWGVQRMVLLGAGLAERLFEAKLPDELALRLKRDQVARQMIAGISRRVFASVQMEPGVFSRFVFRVRMRGTLAEGLPYAIRLALMPTERDRGAGRYPAALYALLRPLRLARIYGWRTRVNR